MNRTTSSWRVPMMLRSAVLTRLSLAGQPDPTEPDPTEPGRLSLAGIGLAAAGCGGTAYPAVSPPPASVHTATEQAAVTNWLVQTNQMETEDDFAAIDRITTGQMRAVYLAEKPQAGLPKNADRVPFRLTGLSITVPCRAGRPAVFVAYGDTDVFDLGTGMQSVAMVFERTGGLWKLAAAVDHPDGSAGWPALCAQGAPPATPAVLAAAATRPCWRPAATRPCWRPAATRPSWPGC